MDTHNPKQQLWKGLKSRAADPDPTVQFNADPVFYFKADPDFAPHQSAGNFRPLKLLNFDFNADPAPTFHPNVDPDPVSKNNADSFGSGSETLLTTEKKLPLIPT
jgi:hypothetical protein